MRGEWRLGLRVHAAPFCYVPRGCRRRHRFALFSLLRPHARAPVQILDPVKELGWLEPPTTSQSRKLLDTRLCTWYMRSPKR